MDVTYDGEIIMEHCLAVEGGGSYCRLGLYDASGALLSESAGGPANPAAYGVSACAHSIAATAVTLLAKRSLSNIRLYVALAGSAEKQMQRDMAFALGALLRPASVLVTSDLHALLHANAGEGTGVLVISGTGAAVLGRDKYGNLQRAGGWGTLLGDEGSAYGVAVSGLRAAARAVDGVALETCLINALPAAANLGSFPEFIGWSTSATKRDIAALTPSIAQAAKDGDIVACACIEEEARRLAALAVAVQERLGIEGEARLFEYGGLLDGCDLFRDAFRSAVAVYSEMQFIPCSIRGPEAVFCLASCKETPDWAFQWTPDTSQDNCVLPVTERQTSMKALDEQSISEFIETMHQANMETASAVGFAKTVIAEAIDYGARALRGGGRIIYVGAGTSGRLGALDAAECPPTFGVSPERVVALMAGGDQAMRTSIEGAEDDAGQGAADIAALRLTNQDFVVGIAASGDTPYVLGALSAAREAGARTALITSNIAINVHVDTLIALDTGPEPLAGSTRLKAGTAAKLVLNMISTGAMTQAGFVYKGRMVGMTPVNKKLRARAARIITELTSISERDAFAILEAAGHHIATAVIMASCNTSREEAQRILQQHAGNLRDALRAASNME